MTTAPVPAPHATRVNRAVQCCLKVLLTPKRKATSSCASMHPDCSWI